MVTAAAVVEAVGGTGPLPPPPLLFIVGCPFGMGFATGGEVGVATAAVGVPAFLTLL